MSHNPSDVLDPIRDGLVRASRAARHGLSRWAHAAGAAARRVLPR